MSHDVTLAPVNYNGGVLQYYGMFAMDRDEAGAFASYHGVRAGLGKKPTYYDVWFWAKWARWRPMPNWPRWKAISRPDN